MPNVKGATECIFGRYEWGGMVAMSLLLSSSSVSERTRPHRTTRIAIAFSTFPHSTFCSWPLPFPAPMNSTFRWGTQPLPKPKGTSPRFVRQEGLKNVTSSLYADNFPTLGQTGWIAASENAPTNKLSRVMCARFVQQKWIKQKNT